MAARAQTGDPHHRERREETGLGSGDRCHRDPGDEPEQDEGEAEMDRQAEMSTEDLLKSMLAETDEESAEAADSESSSTESESSD